MFRLYVVYPNEENCRVTMLNISPVGKIIAADTVAQELSKLECTRKFSVKNPAKTNKIKAMIDNQEPFIFDGHFFRKIIKDGQLSELEKDFSHILGTSKMIKSFNDHFSQQKTDFLSEAI